MLKRVHLKSGVLALCVLGAAALGMAPVGTAGATSTVSGTLKGNGSIDEAWLTGANPGDSISLMKGTAVATATNDDGKDPGPATGTADSLGSLVIRDLTPGTGYYWHDTTTNQNTATFSVLAPGQNPATNSPLYTAQPMHQGLNYITMRDGIKLAATVRFPYPNYPNKTICTAASPCPTVIEYSGYGVAGPADPVKVLIGNVLNPGSQNSNNPLLPDSSTAVGSLVARVAGFATVSLQMRGSGCSGGAYDLFGYPTDYDAYDAIEIVAHQNWVANHKVGMVGISYSGLSEFPSAGTDPPGLAAIAPMSPTDDLFSTGFPGGVFNDGFAAGWFAERESDAKPAADLVGGKLTELPTDQRSGVAQSWTYAEIDAELQASNGAASQCLANQALHNQIENVSTLASGALVAPGTGPGRDPRLFDRRSMTDWAKKIKVPVFLSGALQDEQTGPQWPALINNIPKTTPVFANMVNGGHIDSADPQTISRWLEFLDIFVAQKVPTNPTAIGNLVLDQFVSIASTGVNGQATLPAIRFTNEPNVAAAQAAFEANTPKVRVLFDSGAGTAGAGDPDSTYQAGFSSWPPAGTVTNLFLGSNGTLSSTAGTSSSSTSFTLDPIVRPQTTLSPGGNPWAANPGWDWTTVPSADGIAFQTPAFTSPTTIVGPATLDLEVKASVPVEDFQVSVTEVQPGSSQEEYVTSGFLRSADEQERSDSTPLYTDPTYLGSSETTLSSSAYTLVQIPIDTIAHTFRPGTALRIVISAPGGDRPAWEFDTLDSGQQATVGLGPVAVVPSKLVVDEVSGVTAAATQPTCGSLRGEPCRAYQVEGNQQ